MKSIKVTKANREFRKKMAADEDAPYSIEAIPDGKKLYYYFGSYSVYGTGKAKFTRDVRRIIRSGAKRYHRMSKNKKRIHIYTRPFVYIDEA